MTLQGTNDRQTTRARVFISYKHADPDQQLALKLYEGLRPRLDVFIDREIPVGMDWARRINAELEQADFFVLLLSEQSIHSEMVIGELDFVRDLAAERPDRRPYILPVRIARLARLPYPQSAFLRYAQWVDWNAPDDTSYVIERLLASIATLCNGQEQLRAQQVGAPPVDDIRAADRGGQASPALPGLWMPSGWPLPKGALHFASTYYVERPVDSRVYDYIRRPGVTISVFGPRQIGKTSLLARLAQKARAQGKQVAWIDFQLFEKRALTDASMFYRQLCGRISDMLGMKSQVEAFWNENNGDAFTCERYIERYVLRDSGPLVLIMDEVERVLDAPFRSDFFSMLRSWHDQRALVENNLQQLDLVLAASTEPKLWIPDPNRSPFTVGMRVDLDDFSVENVQDLNERYGSPLSDAQLRRLIDLLHGHPYLIHFAIYSVANKNYDADGLFDRARRDDGPFADHLNHLLFRLSGKTELTNGMRRIIAKRTCGDDELYARLRGAGLVRREEQRGRVCVLPSRQLYADYFSDRLKPARSWPPWRIFSG
jgi:hypothetical protein